ncbi:mitochondrial Mrx15/TMEM223-like protein [Andalucia godoyi]|uniref:Mitochondrial Mrx15/TMEM223-like protein n=1 Tax=Andalucia godoyi TaxID=505711 RepID=A0A8K0AII9_ANDGO|nr:mitochondrial Mrx15/TMEM223-like protein [Andalucia godoyi]|eukprot:ANDGO_08298.mRNA.1 mitochondrial Mrx15/TMEM223 homolog
MNRSGRVLFLSNHPMIMGFISGSAVLQGAGLSYLGYAAMKDAQEKDSRGVKAPLWQRAGLGVGFAMLGVFGFTAAVYYTSHSVRRLVLSPDQTALVVETYGFLGGLFKKSLTVSRQEIVPGRSPAIFKDPTAPPSGLLTFRVPNASKAYFLVDIASGTAPDRVALYKAIFSPFAKI